MSKTQATPIKRSLSTSSKPKTKPPSNPPSKAVATKTPTKKRKRPSQPEASQDDGFSSLSEDETFQTAPSPFNSSPVKAQFPNSVKAKKVRFDDLNGLTPVEPASIENGTLDDDDDENDESESDSDAAPEAESTSQSAASAHAVFADSQRANLAQRDEKRRRNRDVNSTLKLQAEKRRSKVQPQPTPNPVTSNATSAGDLDEISRFLRPDGTLPNVLPDELIELFARDEQASLMQEIQEAQAARRLENAIGQGRRKIVFKEADRRDVTVNGKTVRVLRKEGLHPPKSAAVGRVKAQWLDNRKGRGRVEKRSSGFAKR